MKLLMNRSNNHTSVRYDNILCGSLFISCTYPRDVYMKTSMVNGNSDYVIAIRIIHNDAIKDSLFYNGFSPEVKMFLVGQYEFSFKLE